MLVDNVPYSQDFKKNNDSAVTFFDQHSVGSTSYCHYNPRNLQQVRIIPFSYRQPPVTY